MANVIITHPPRYSVFRNSAPVYTGNRQNLPRSDAREPRPCAESLQKENKRFRHREKHARSRLTKSSSSAAACTSPAMPRETTCIRLTSIIMYRAIIYKLRLHHQVAFRKHLNFLTELKAKENHFHARTKYTSSGTFYSEMSAFNQTIADEIRLKNSRIRLTALATLRKIVDGAEGAKGRALNCRRKINFFHIYFLPVVA